MHPASSASDSGQEMFGSVDGPGNLLSAESPNGNSTKSTNFLAVRAPSSQSSHAESDRNSGGSSPVSRQDSNGSRNERTHSRMNDGMESRVILRMEVDSAVHPHLIGKDKEVISKLRTETSCNVNFPHENRSGSPNGTHGFPHLHDNEVSIRGKLTNVVSACGKIRDLIPFQFSFVAPEETFGSTLADQRPGHILGFQNVFDMDVGTSIGAGGATMVHIRGPQSLRTLLGASGVCEQFKVGTEDIQVTQTIRIHPHSQSLMMTLCDAAAWMERVSSVTKTRIKFPDGRGRGSQDRQSVTITGLVNGVAAAWIVLMSMLPVTLRVFVNDVIEYKDIEKYTTDVLHVNFLAPRRDPRPEDRQYVEFRSYERNLDNICKAYYTLLGQNVPTSSLPDIVAKLTRLGLGFALPAIEEKFPMAELPPSPPPANAMPLPYPHIPFMPPPFGFMPMPAPMYYPVPAPFFMPMPAPLPAMLPHLAGMHHMPRRNGSSSHNGKCRLGPDNCDSCLLVQNCSWLSNGALDKLKHSLSNGQRGMSDARHRDFQMAREQAHRQRNSHGHLPMHDNLGTPMFRNGNDSGYDWMDSDQYLMDQVTKPTNGRVSRSSDYFTSMECMFVEMSRSGIREDQDTGMWSSDRNTPQSCHTDWGEWNFEGKPKTVEPYSELNPDDFPPITYWNS